MEASFMDYDRCMCSNELKHLHTTVFSGLLPILMLPVNWKASDLAQTHFAPTRVTLSPAEAPLLLLGTLLTLRHQWFLVIFK